MPRTAVRGFVVKLTGEGLRGARHVSVRDSRASLSEPKEVFAPFRRAGTSTSSKANAGLMMQRHHQITDAVTQSNMRVLGDAPALALAFVYQATAQALAKAAPHATAAQQQAQIQGIERPDHRFNDTGRRQSPD